MGGKRVTTEIYMKEVVDVHKGKGYEYEPGWEYTGSKCPIKIKCPDHGWWTTKAYSHRNMKSGCPVCAETTHKEMCERLKQEKRARDNTALYKRHEERDDYVIQKVSEKYGNEIEILSECVPEGCYIYVRCRKHGYKYFRKTQQLYKGKGCPECGEEARRENIERLRTPQEDVLKRFVEIHGDRYDYSKVEYDSVTTKVEIVCREHGSFWMRPANHINTKSGCKLCYLDNLAETSKRPDEEWIEIFKETHGDRYDYSNTKNIHSGNLCTVRCKEHGDFKILPRRHYSGWGCYWCDVPSSGFKVFLPGLVYYLRITCPNTGKLYYKIGITNFKDIHQRFYTQSNSTYDVLKVWRYSQGRTALNRETAILRKYRSCVTNDPLDFWRASGKTEIFDRDVLNYDKYKE